MLRKGIKFWTAAGIGLLGIWGLAHLPATTRQGLNFKVSTQQIPLYVKGSAFLHQHFQLHLLSTQITRDCASDQERVLAVFNWTRRNIRITPKGWPVVDDHILHIIIRGYGLEDQMADVFTTLSTYAGVPAFWQAWGPAEGGEKRVFSFALLGGKWVPFDVANGVLFKNTGGELADINQLRANPSLADRTREGFPLRYSVYFQGMEPLQPPPILRAQKQMPGRRICYEAGRIIGFRPHPNRNPQH